MLQGDIEQGAGSEPSGSLGNTPPAFLAERILCAPLWRTSGLYHPAENPNIKARAGAGPDADGDIPSLGGEDGFRQC